MTDLRGLASRLRRLEAARFHVVTLPDFFLDHFVPAPAWNDSIPRWEQVHSRGGGNVPSPGQHLVPGGNAANTALGLARLGVRTHLITRTSAFGKSYLEHTLGRRGVDLAHVRPDGDLAVSTVIEFAAKHPHNVMLSDPGSVADFGPDKLTPNDWTLVEAADMVLVTNWSQNARGTDLVEAVVRAAHKAGRRTMLDTGDPSVRDGALPDLTNRLIPLQELDVYALNENELQQVVGRPLDGKAAQLDAARELAAKRGGKMLDLHTASFAASFSKEGETVVPTFQVKPLRVTGAGDSWNAGNALGHLAGLPPAERLTLANAVAGLYISGPDGAAPTLDAIVRFLESAPPMTSAD